MKSFGLTDKGAVRKDNQDSFILEKCRNNLIVALCDGMGGAKAGGIQDHARNGLSADAAVGLRRGQRGRL